MTFEKLICFSGGGPPFGIPLIITESPDKTWINKLNYYFFTLC